MHYNDSNSTFENEVRRIFGYLVTGQVTEKTTNECRSVSYVEFFGPQYVIRFGYEPYSEPWCWVMDPEAKTIKHEIKFQIPANNEHPEEQWMKRHLRDITTWLEAAVPILNEWLERNA